VDSIVFWALMAALYPSLLAATTVMLLLDHPKRLMAAYLAGAMLVSVSIGLVIVFTLEGSSGATNTTRHTLSPAMDLVLGGILLVIAYVIRPSHPPREGGRLAERRRRRSEKRAAEGPPRWQAALSKGSPRAAFVVGVALTLPGASYLIGLKDIDDLDAGTVATIVLVIGFNVIMLSLLELPLIAFAVAPEWTTRPSIGSRRGSTATPPSSASGWR
jgi:Sap, sulfolipid-1-addressing protein